MFYSVLMGLFVLFCFLLVVVVLMQAGKGGGIAAMGGGADQFLGGRAASNVLVKSTWTLAIVFMIGAILLNWLGPTKQAPGQTEGQRAIEATPAIPPSSQPQLPPGQ